MQIAKARRAVCVGFASPKEQALEHVKSKRKNFRNNDLSLFLPNEE